MDGRAVLTDPVILASWLDRLMSTWPWLPTRDLEPVVSDLTRGWTSRALRQRIDQARRRMFGRRWPRRIPRRLASMLAEVPATSWGVRMELAAWATDRAWHEIAEYTGVTARRMVAYRHLTVTPPRVDDAIALAQVFGVTVPELFGRPVRSVQRVRGVAP